MPWACLVLTRPGAKTSTSMTQEQIRACLPALAEAPASASRSLALAFANARLGDNDAYLAAWKDFTSNAPRSPAANAHERGLENFYRQDYEPAAADLNTWLKLHPHDLQADYLLARTYRNLSLSTLEQLLATAPDSYAAHQLLARDLPERRAGRQSAG